MKKVSRALMRLSSSGHRAISTLHTNSACEVPNRLFLFRALAGIGERTNGALIHGHCFCLGITFAAGFEVVVEIGSGMQGWNSVLVNTFTSLFASQRNRQETQKWTSKP